jgi:hypothetical protein
MIRITILIFLILSIPLKAEIVRETGKHRHLGDITKINSCKIAEEKAKKNAIIKSLGQTISSEVVSNCTEVDGEFDCERNQSALLELNGDITSFKRIGKPKYGEEIGNDVIFCEITIEANIEPIKKNLDPSFQFDVKLNQQIFRTGENLEIEITTSKKMYMAIFQWLPYGGKKYNVITKIFPNKDYHKNTNDLVDGKLELIYETYFPEEIKKNKIDEYLIFIASKKPINWLPNYTQIERLKRQLSKTNILMEKHISGYILIK